MAAKTIACWIEKGGCSKTTTSGIVSFLLSKRINQSGNNNRVLALDLDPQANLTSLLGLKIDDFAECSIKQAIEQGDITNFRIAVTDNLHIVPGHPDFATFPLWLQNEYQGIPALVLKKAIEPILSEYDYVIIDSPPSISHFSITALSAADYLCAPCETSIHCKQALDRLVSTVDDLKNVNPELKIAGVVISMIDKKRADNKALLNMITKEYGDLCFETITSRKAATGRLGITGFHDNKELRAAIGQFEPLTDEVIARCR